VHRGQSLEEAIRSEAGRLGFCACGFTRADTVDAAGLDVERWLEAGHHGTMGWMEERAHHRVSPLALWPEAKSAIALGMSYAPTSNPLALAARPELGRISVYAQGGDYHKTVKKALKALARFIVDRSPSELKVFVDTAPVMEKPLAQAAGIGWQGKHTNVVSREHGSWMFLGVILTSLDLQADPPALLRRGQRQRIGGGGVAHAQRDHARRFGPQRLRRGALVGARLHPPHRPVMARAEPFAEALAPCRLRARRRHPERGEAQPLGFGGQIALQVVEKPCVYQTCCRSPSPLLGSGG
jgi:hypothetical protein